MRRPEVCKQARAGGFTLIELLVAITIGGAVALLTHRMFVGLADGAARVEEARVALDREMNGQRMLTELAAGLEVGTPSATEFNGEPERVAFTTWALGPEGWPRRYAVALQARHAALVVLGLGDQAIQLVRPADRVDFDYLLDPGATEHWVRRWLSSVSAPVAVRVRVYRRDRVDTLLLIVGTRG